MGNTAKEIKSEEWKQVPQEQNRISAMQEITEIPWYNKGNLYCCGCTKRITSPSACNMCGIIF